MTIGNAGTQSESLSGAEDCFLKVVKPNYDALFGAPSDFASAFNLATTLYHFHEWLFDSCGLSSSPRQTWVAPKNSDGFEHATARTMTGFLT